MTDHTHSPIPDPASDAGAARPHRARQVLGRAAALLAAGLFGAAGTLLVLRVWQPAPATPSPAVPSAGVNDMPPMDSADDGSVYISPARQQMIGVRTARAAARDLSGAIRTVGTLAYDETRVTQIHTKVAGWIEALFVDFAGKAIQKGQPLFTIYSPDVVATEHEYLLARKAQAELAASQFEESRQSASSLLAASRRRLALWDISEGQIAELERTGEPRRTVTLFSPASGIVLERNGFSGQYVTPEMSLFKVADLSTIWAVGQVADSESANLRVGQRATIELSNSPGARPLVGRVSFIYPDIDPATRRLRVRVDVPNPALALKPDMFVTLTIQTSTMRAVAVPAEAVIDTGEKQYVILAREGGRFEPRPVEVGPSAGEYVPVLSGLAEGEAVVVSAQFLVDSETNLRAAMQAMASMPMPESHQGHGVGPAPAGTSSGEKGQHDAAPPESTPRTLSIDLRTVPAPARSGGNTFEATVLDAEKKPIVDAAVAVNLFMPAMPAMGMPAMRSGAALEPAGAGTYRGTGQVPMAGRWEVTVTVTKAGARLGSRQLVLLAR